MMMKKVKSKKITKPHKIISKKLSKVKGPGFKKIKKLKKVKKR